MPESKNRATAKVRPYADILCPLFWDQRYDVKVDAIFDMSCSLLRANGMRDTGWDSYAESIAFLGDFTALMQIEFPKESFPQPESTQTRLALTAYSHMIEMNVPYELLANLLRVRLGMRYSTDPLIHLDTFDRKSKRIRRAVPRVKINEIKKLSEQAGMPEVGTALEGIYNNTIRNAIAHSDYAVHDGSLRLLSGSMAIISFEELGETTSSAFAFHSALLLLWKRQLRRFTGFKGKMLPFDPVCKGVLEFVYEDDDALMGLRVYWPNGQTSYCGRDADGTTHATNIEFECDGRIGFFVGIYASKPSEFSPLVEDGSDPNYAVIPGTDKRPHWPHNLKAYVT
jgi:hypothetical protein